MWLCLHRFVGQRAIKGIARPAVVPCTRSVQLHGVLYTPATIQVRSMVVTLGTRQFTLHAVQIQGLHACVQRCVNAAVHTCMSHLLQGRACPHVVCNQRLHRRLSLYTVVQAAVKRLERETAYAFSQEMVKSRPLSQFFLGWPAWRCNRHLYTVHEVPHVMWRHTRSSSDGSESAPEVWSDLTDAALVLLKNPTLAGVIRPQQQQQQQQHHSKAHGALQTTAKIWAFSSRELGVICPGMPCA